MKLKLDSAWYEKAIGDEESQHVAAGPAHIALFLEEAQKHRTALSQSQTNNPPLKNIRFSKGSSSS